MFRPAQIIRARATLMLTVTMTAPRITTTQVRKWNSSIRQPTTSLNRCSSCVRTNHDARKTASSLSMTLVSPWRCMTMKSTRLRTMKGACQLRRGTSPTSRICRLPLRTQPLMRSARSSTKTDENFSRCLPSCFLAKSGYHKLFNQSPS